MDLHITLAAGPGVTLAAGEATEELVIRHANLLSGAQLHHHLAARVGAPHFTVDGAPITDLKPGEAPLISGAVIVAAHHEHPCTRRTPPGNLYFLVRSGPDAGKSVPLSRGTYSIGRSAADITIRDPDLSRVHAVLSVGNESLSLVDRNSANGVWVDGIRVGRAQVTTESDILIGSSRCAIILADSLVEPPLAVDLSEPCEISAPPPPEERRLLLFTALLPLVLGIVLAVTTGMWFFLAFSALSTVTGLIPLVTGRRKAKAFDAAVAIAVAEDTERRRCAAPDPGGLAMAALRVGTSGFSQAPSATGPGYLRLGIADQPAHIRPKTPSSQWRGAPVIERAPVLVPLVEPGGGGPLHLTIRGQMQTLSHVAQLLLLQLSALPDAGGILCFAGASELPAAARFLPRVTLVSRRAVLDELLRTGRYSYILIFGPGFVAAAPDQRVYRFSNSTEQDGGMWTADYLLPEPTLKTPAGSIIFKPDLIREETFDSLARSAAARDASHSEDDAGTLLPGRVPLTDLLKTDDASIAARWAAPAGSSELRADVGCSVTGPLSVDLISNGPHLLIAGTTGSGKSEFLRVLVLGLALKYSPANLNFLFIDFKGGSGLGALRDLPQVTGMLTDLSAASVSRALVSLQAEVKRRESLFQKTGAADFLEYNGRVPVALPRLVVVIDEFRMLSEEVPGSVNELMRIATVGRSLGLHLVLATQRPQGAVTSDIRANITASIALRMQSAMESQDVLDSAVASTIPVDLPGRGYLRIGTGQPVEFQAATTASNLLRPFITSFHSYLTSGSVQYRASGASRRSLSSSAGETTETVPCLVAAAARTASALSLEPPWEPVRSPLPVEVNRAAEVEGDAPQLGLLDVPERQEQRPLLWVPERHSHLAVVGHSGSGMAAVLASVAAEHVRCMPDRHLYVLDGDSSMHSLMNAPQVGAYVAGSEPKRAARVLQRVSETVLTRLDNPRDPSAAALTLFVTGWGRWVASFRNSRRPWAEDTLQDIVRDGEAAGVALVISGERDLIASRCFSLLPNRLYLPLGVNPESLLNWPRLPIMDAVPGRAFVQGRISARSDAVAQLITDPELVPPAHPTKAPFPVAALPHEVSTAVLQRTQLDRRRAFIPIGVREDDLATAHLVLPERATALIVGASGTGKTQTLDVIANMASPTLTCLRLSPGQDPVVFWEAAAETDAEGLLLLIDDAEHLPRHSQQELTKMLAAGARTVLSCSPSVQAAGFPAISSMRTNPLGVVLGPRTQSDGDVFGLRLDVDGTPPPGRGILVSSGSLKEIQIAICESTGSGEVAQR